MAFARIGEIELYYERRGDGPPLLFISGTGGDLRNEPTVFKSPLGASFDLLAYDQRGLGQSGKPDIAYTMADYANDAAGLMDAVGWRRAHVIGVSFGGMVAQELALRHASRIDRLVLACTSPGGAGGASYPLHEIAHMSMGERARHMIPIADTRHDAAWAQAHADTYETLVTVAATDRYADEPGRAHGAYRQLEARAIHDTWDRLPDMAVPTLICGGRYDGIALPETQRAMASRIPGAKFAMFDGGHLFMLQDRTAFPAMIEFLTA